MTSAIVFVGLIMLSSATSVLSFDITGGERAYVFVIQQLTHGIIPGLLLFICTVRINYHSYREWLPWFGIASIALPLLVFIPGLGVVDNNVQSWISIAGITIQTSEIAKLTFILWLAGYLERIESRVASGIRVLIPACLMLALIASILMLQPDTGTAFLFAATAIVMFYAANVRFRDLLIIIVLGAAGIIPMLFSARYKLERIVAFLNPSADIQGIGYQVHQALIALGSGFWFGVGIGKSQQKFKFVPEVESDSIFAIIGEEWGFLLSAGLIFAFWILISRGIHIASRAPDTFGRLIVVGGIGLIAIQTIVNIGAMVGLVPLTGLPLPLISLGGTNMAVLLALLGIIANISRQNAAHA